MCAGRVRFSVWVTLARPSRSIPRARARARTLSRFPDRTGPNPVQRTANQLLYQLSYAGIHEGKYSLVPLPRISFYTPFLYGSVRDL
jgi:hypothetical protein